MTAFCLFVFEAKFKGLVMELCEELTMAPKFLPGMMEGIAMPFPKKLNLERVTMIQVETGKFEILTGYLVHI